jgi:hypothetical protein
MRLVRMAIEAGGDGEPVRGAFHFGSTRPGDWDADDRRPELDRDEEEDEKASDEPST